MAHDIHAEMQFPAPVRPEGAPGARYGARQERQRGAWKSCASSTSAPALPVRKLLTSAVANAEENFGVSRDDLFVAQIFANEAPTRKWRRFGARGRFKPILRRTSHVTVVLRERGS